ncbi:MAG: formylglycine-generating enzyme family protein [Hyphomonadaceae bacterium]|nr:formylglycine-generating enzyme family protein [Hyphomonadaceae bacterium]
MTAPVGSFYANASGLYDMHGNVWEWVEDCYQDSYDGAPVDGSARQVSNCSYRVLRGGAWNGGPNLGRWALRYWRSSNEGDNHIGFRVARTL